MRRHIVYTVGLALALTGAGAWAADTQGTGNGAGAGTELQNPAPPNPNPPAAPDQAAPNAAQPKPAPANEAQPNPIPSDQPQPNPAPANPAPTNPTPANPAPTNPAPANPAPVNPAPPAPEQPNAVPTNPRAPSGTGQQAATPTYSSPLQEFMSRQLDEVGELSQELTQFQAAKKPDAVMALYHMIRDHRLMADAAANILARRGESATPIFTSMPIPDTPEEAIRQDIQGHQQTASDLQQMIANANTPEEKRLYQHALNGTNQHLAWLQKLDQNQQVAVGFFDATTPLGDLSGTTTVASAEGYPQPVISRTAGFQQQYAGNNSTGYVRRTSMRRSYRHRRYHRRRYSRSSRWNSYR
jgi:hypothetical protein